MITKSIRDLLNDQAARAVSPDTTISDAHDTLIRNGISAMVVLKDGIVLGIVTETDMIRHVSQYGGMDVTPVSEVMTRDVRFIETRDSITEAASLMADRGLDHLPVLDTWKGFVGVLSADDIPEEYHRMRHCYTRWKQNERAA